MSLSARAVSLCLLVVVSLSSHVAFADDKLVAPFIDGPWTQIAGNPDLGDYTSPRQQPVDFAVWQAADGTWQALSCIRGTKCGGQTRLLYRWEGKNLTDPDWKPMGILMESIPDLGEEQGGLQAPHVVKEGDTYHMCYGDWNNICHATSKDGKHFERVIQPHGGTAVFSEGPGCGTRDVMLLKIDGLWHGYYTAYPNDQGTDFVRTTRDFDNWSEPTAVALGGIAGIGKFSAECPHVVYHDGYYYLFRTQMYGRNNISRIYRSKDPLMFGVNEDELYHVGSMAVAAPEIIQHEGQDYIVALNTTLDGLRIAKLGWREPPQVGEPVFALDDASHREGWKVESGVIHTPLIVTRRIYFNSPQFHFVGTAELPRRRLDDNRQGVVRSPEFTMTDDQYYAYVSGGTDKENLYVAVVDADTDKELLRFSSPASTNVMEPMLIDTQSAQGRRVYLKIVDNATGNWGHINFGGLHRVE
ncbi:hypothetical protein [Aeoliella sp.]|uniref:hypothetical protein n=1 Tax=Aeoliella sp. TaxID=2795800 RepID=UPI003CCC0B2E